MEQLMNQLGRDRIPFLFVIDFELRKPIVIPLYEIDKEEVLFHVPGHYNYNESDILACKENINFRKFPVSFENYRKAFAYVVEQEKAGNSYLTNLTFPSRIKLNKSLRNLFFICEAPYKLYFKNEFVVFSPESFIKIDNGKITSFPMKGTIDADIYQAEEIILNDPKEAAEHATIVDLIRNDMSRIANNVQVKKYRYIDKILTNEKKLLQVSSEIQGDLYDVWQEQVGSIIFKLLPAGSVSGAPKDKTLDIIRKAEKQERGYYTGVFGIFTGQELISAVMIRFIYNKRGVFYYHSGGGITTNSDCEMEYQELVDKVYLPL